MSVTKPSIILKIGQFLKKLEREFFQGTKKPFLAGFPSIWWKARWGQSLFQFPFMFRSSHFSFLVFGHFWWWSYKNTKILSNLCLHFARQDGQKGPFNHFQLCYLLARIKYLDITRYLRTGAPYVVRPARPRSYLDFEK